MRPLHDFGPVFSGSEPIHIDFVLVVVRVGIEAVRDDEVGGSIAIKVAERGCRG